MNGLIIFLIALIIIFVVVAMIIFLIRRPPSSNQQQEVVQSQEKVSQKMRQLFEEDSPRWTNFQMERIDANEIPNYVF